MSSLVFPSSLPGFSIAVTRESYRDVRIEESVSGKETRSSWWFAPRVKYNVAFTCLRANGLQEFQTLDAFMSRHFGQQDSFLFTDPEDNTVTAHGFGVGDGSTSAFQLQRTLGGYYSDALGTYPTSSTPRTNQFTFAQAFDNAAWVKTSCSATPGAAMAPDGTMTACKLIEAAATSTHDVSEHARANLTTGAFSVYAKAAERSRIVLSNDNNIESAAFDLSAGTVLAAANGGAGTIQSVGSGWWRCSMTFTATANDNTLKRIGLSNGGTLPQPSYAGDGTSGVYIWGTQFESPATAATQYIPTTSAAVTVNPAYWPAFADGFVPVYEPAPGPTILVGAVAKTLGTDYLFGTVAGGLVAGSAGQQGAITFMLPPPSAAPGVTPSASGGTLAAGAKFYVVSALNASGESIGSAEATCTTTGATGSVALTWLAVTGATSYRVYRGTIAGGESVYYAPGNVTSYTDTNATSAAGSPLALATGVQPPASGAVLTWTGSFYRRCRLDTPGLQLDRVVNGMWSAKVALRSVKP